MVTAHHACLVSEERAAASHAADLSTFSMLNYWYLMV